MVVSCVLGAIDYFISREFFFSANFDICLSTCNSSQFELVSMAILRIRLTRGTSSSMRKASFAESAVGTTLGTEDFGGAVLGPSSDVEHFVSHRTSKKNLRQW